MLVTGSMRAFRELYARHPQNQLVNGMVARLAEREPYLFINLFRYEDKLADDTQLQFYKLSLHEVDELPMELRLKHRFVGVRFIVNRAVTHEIVRHRPCSFLQESQRYCRYSQDKFENQVSFIKPMFYDEGSEEFVLWKESMEASEAIYLKLLKSSSPQAARTVLPNSCKTEIIVYCNLEEWKHIFFLRTSQAAEPSMREIMIPLREEMQKVYSFS